MSMSVFGCYSEFIRRDWEGVLFKRETSNPIEVYVCFSGLKRRDIGGVCTFPVK